MFLVRSPLLRFAALPLAVAVALGTAAGGAQAAKTKKSKGKRDAYAISRPVGPALVTVVSLDAQRVTIYDAEGKVVGAPVSSGTFSRETPVGIYSILQKNAEHYSNLYNNAAMPHMQRITWSGVALHGGPLPGYPASHGCVRMPFKFAKNIFDVTRLGTRVIISNENVAPVAISHPFLFKRQPYRQSAGLITKAVAMAGDAMALGAPPAPGNEPADVAERRAHLNEIVTAKSAEADKIDKEAEPARVLAKNRKPAWKSAKKTLSRAEKARDSAAKSVAYHDKKLSRTKSEKWKQRYQQRKDKAQAKLDEAETKLEAVRAKVQPNIDAYEEAAADLKELEDARDAARAEADDAKRKLSPVKVFISRATQKLYVRQGFQPIFETDVLIDNPRRAIGTHTYTAMDYGADGRDMRWNVVSISGRGNNSYARYEDDYYGYNDYDDYDDYYKRQFRQKQRQLKRKAKLTPTDREAAMAALDRITIPEEARERISELVLPGASLIVSDEEAHKETGKQTGFVVLISGEPQGAIAKRPKNDWEDDYYGYNSYYERRERRRDRRRMRRRGPGGWW
jgi:L,D-transpeptidase catalytic domain